MNCQYMLITGGRQYRGLAQMRVHLQFAKDKCVSTGRDLVVIHGGAAGADSIAERVARELEIPTQVFPADWEQHGRSAGFKRNEVMARCLLEMEQIGDEVCVVAFPGASGTQHMRHTAKKMGLKVYAPHA